MFSLAAVIRCTRRGVSWPPNSGRYMTFIRAKDNTFVWLTVSPQMEQVSIYLRYVSGGVTKETFIGYSLRPSKIGTAIVHYFFLPAGAAWQTSCVRHLDKTRFDPPNGCWPVRLCCCLYVYAVLYILDICKHYQAKFYFEVYCLNKVNIITVLVVCRYTSSEESAQRQC